MQARFRAFSCCDYHPCATAEPSQRSRSRAFWPLHTIAPPNAQTGRHDIRKHVTRHRIAKALMNGRRLAASGSRSWLRGHLRTTQHVISAHEHIRAGLLLASHMLTRRAALTCCKRVEVSQVDHEAQRGESSNSVDISPAQQFAHECE